MKTSILRWWGAYLQAVRFFQVNYQHFYKTWRILNQAVVIFYEHSNTDISLKKQYKRKYLFESVYLRSLI